ncbi:MAG: ribose 5-phosphate isomerase B [Pleomorphochaeta sp.]
MKIIIGCDNAAVGLKNEIISFLETKDCEIVNVGCDTKEDPTYYPEIAKRVCEKVQESNYEARGILICGTGLGMSMTANKFKGIRAALCHDCFSAERAVLSNDANVLCLGERVIGYELAKKIVDTWLPLKFKDGRSTAKVALMNKIDSDNLK